MTATSLDFTTTGSGGPCEQGATFSRQVLWKDSLGVPINLTGFTGRMQLRKSYNSLTYIISLTTENGGITLGGVLGTIDILMTASQTAAITAGNYLYDLELVNGSTVYRLLSGSIEVTAEVTK